MMRTSPTRRARSPGVPYLGGRSLAKPGALAERKHAKVSKLDLHQAFLRQLADEREAIKLDEVREALAQRGVKASNTAIWDALERFAIGSRVGAGRLAARNQFLKSGRISEMKFNTAHSLRPTTPRPMHRNQAWTIDLAALDIENQRKLRSTTSLSGACGSFSIIPASPPCAEHLAIA